MILDIGTTTVQVTKSLRKIGGDELYEKILSVMVDVWWILDTSLQDVFIDFDRRASVPEWGEAAEHFEDQNTQ